MKTIRTKKEVLRIDEIVTYVCEVCNKEFPYNKGGAEACEQQHAKDACVHDQGVTYEICGEDIYNGGDYSDIKYNPGTIEKRCNFCYRYLGAIQLGENTAEHQAILERVWKMLFDGAESSKT